jgi:molybdate transport system ATP-binding protein
MIHIDIQKELQGSNGAMPLDISLDIASSSFVAISGKSGSGKSTFLRILAGLSEAKGKIVVDDEVWLDGKFSLDIQSRQIGFVFQDYALFENMSILKNLLFVNKDKELAHTLLDICELQDMSHRLPSMLSGGQKQRVALCRAMMKRPKLLLLDEPLSALDVQMRVKLQDEISKLHSHFGTTTLMVSHDPSEIYKLSQRVIILEQGKVVEDGTPQEILLHNKGSQKFSFDGKVLDIIKADTIYIAIVAIGQQIVEVVLTPTQAQSLKVGDMVSLSSKAFGVNIGYNFTPTP